MNTIVVLGGGSAGWLTALFIRTVYPTCKITVIEDPATPPIIAGESGSASLNKLYNFLEINFNDWIPAVNAMPKLGGKLTDWNGVGSSFTHGLIPDWYALDYKAYHPEFGNANDFISCTVAENIPLENIFYNGVLQNIGKLPITPSDTDTTFNVLTMPMWHFDSRANAEFLKTLGRQRGIELVEGKYLFSTKKETGDIASIHLDTHQTVSADWFFDCSGFARLLLQKELAEQPIDLSDKFTASTVMAWWDDTPELKPYTGLTALKYGWAWNINLHHRAGNGYIYDSNYITAEQAIEEVETQFNIKITPVANLKFTPALMKKAWKNNVIAIGLSSGFLEPLESNGLAAVAEQLKLVSEYWSPSSNSASEQTQFNNANLKVMNGISDFLSLHYRGHRSDTEFWRDHNHNPARVSDALRERLDLWSAGVVGVDNSELYAFENYIVVAQGLDLINKSKLKSRLLAKRSTIFNEFYQSFNRLEKDIDNIAKICYTIEEWNTIVYGKN